MSAFATLSSGRVCLRQWQDADRDAFAAMNCDARVMQFFANSLSRDESDAMVDRIEEHFNNRGFGLWAVEVPGVASFIGFAGLSVLTGPPFAAQCSPLCRGRLASGLRTLGTRLCDRGGRIGARPCFRSAGAFGSRVLHVRDQPAFARRHGAAWDAPRSRRRFRPSAAAGRSSATQARPLPDARLKPR